MSLTAHTHLPGMPARDKKQPKRVKRHPTRKLEVSPWLAPIGLALIMLTTFAIYWPSVRGGPLLDDDLNITKPELQSLDGLYRIWFDPSANAQAQYYPLVHTAFWIEHKLWADAYFGYHVINVLWHCASVVLLYLILARLRIPGALLAAAIFAFHPVMVESVAWMSEQKNTLSTVFYLSAALAYLEFDESRRRSHYVLCMALFALALLTKTATLTLPVALLAIMWWQRGALSWHRDVLPVLPFVALGIAAGLMTVWVERTYFHSESIDFTLSPVERFLLAGRAIWFYVGKLLWPSVAFIYPQWNIDPAQWWQWIFPIATLATTFALWAIRKRYRAPLAAWLCFCGTLFPLLGFVNVHYFIHSFVADHFQYLASLSLILLAGAGFALVIQRLPTSTKWLGTLCCALIVGALAVLSFQESYNYVDAATLYQTTVRRNPDCWLAHINMASALLEQNNPQAAIDHCRAAVRLQPNHFGAHQNLAKALMQTGRLPEAVAEMRLAASLNPDDPMVLDTLGGALLQNGQYADASSQFERSLQLRPDDAIAHYNLGVLLSYTDKTPEAIAHFEQAIRLSPNYTHAHNALAVALQHEGRHSEALEHFQTALQLEPKFVLAYPNLAQELAGANRSQEAIDTAKKGIDAARTSGNESAAQQMEDWLNHYQTELRRAAGAASLPVPSPQAHKPSTPQ
jgi:tetratricopeptide (TPR) repeat protein